MNKGKKLNRVFIPIDHSFDVRTGRTVLRYNTIQYKIFFLEILINVKAGRVK
jgi:hypothetical protein